MTTPPFTHLIARSGMRERCVTLVGPSKTESLSGYRVGAVVGRPDVLDAVEQTLAMTSLRAPAYAQHVLRRWLVDDHDFVTTREATAERRFVTTCRWTLRELMPHQATFALATSLPGRW